MVLIIRSGHMASLPRILDSTTEKLCDNQNFFTCIINPGGIAVKLLTLNTFRLLSGRQSVGNADCCGVQHGQSHSFLRGTNENLKAG